MENYTRFVVEGEISIEEIIDRVAAAIRYCREKKIPRLLVDLTRLKVSHAPLTHERYWAARRWAAEAGSTLVVAAVAQKELIDVERFGLLVAQNADMRAFISSDENEAVAWLLTQEAF